VGYVRYVGYVRGLDSQNLLLAQEDLSTLQDAEQDAALEQLIARDSTAPFDLSADSMVRARLIKLSDTEHVLTLVMHHIAGDGVSMGVFCQELTQAYQARSSGQTPGQAPDQAPDWARLSVSYADYAAWQRTWLEDSGELARQSQSWQAQLAGSGFDRGQQLQIVFQVRQRRHEEMQTTFAGFGAQRGAHDALRRFVERESGSRRLIGYQPRSALLTGRGGGFARHFPIRPIGRQRLRGQRRIAHVLCVLIARCGPRQRIQRQAQAERRIAGDQIAALIAQKP
jgi:hypothetical protein